MNQNKTKVTGQALWSTWQGDTFSVTVMPVSNAWLQGVSLYSLSIFPVLLRPPVGTCIISVLWWSCGQTLRLQRSFSTSYYHILFTFLHFSLPWTYIMSSVWHLATLIPCACPPKVPAQLLVALAPLAGTREMYVALWANSGRNPPGAAFPAPPAGTVVTVGPSWAGLLRQRVVKMQPSPTYFTVLQVCSLSHTFARAVRHLPKMCCCMQREQLLVDMDWGTPSVALNYRI